MDVSFFLKNPTVPLEDLCARLDNYYPKNETQGELLTWAKNLADWDDFSRAAGLYVTGQAGVGKTHIAVAVAKEFMRRGFEPHYFIADNRVSASFSPYMLAPGQIWIIDDLNSGYSVAAHNVFKSVVLNAHNAGGIVLTTSNKPYQKFLDELFGGSGSNEAERMRYDDRTKALFKLVEVTGESARQHQAWYTKE